MKTIVDEIFKPLGYNDQKYILGNKNWLSGLPGLNETLLIKPLKISPFVFLFKKKNYYIFYHSLNLKKTIGDERFNELYRIARTANHMKPDDFQRIFGDDTIKILSHLIENEFLLTYDTDPYKALREIQADERFARPDIGLLTLLLTDRCNMKCGYCTRAHNLQSIAATDMSMILARAGIDLFLKVLKKDSREHDALEVVYQGGEPFLNLPTLFDSLSYLCEKKQLNQINERNIRAIIFSNGTSVTVDSIKRLKEYSIPIEISISLDGLKHHHDAMRTYCDGTSAWKDTIRGFKMIKNCLGRCGISFSLGIHNYNDIEEIIEFFLTNLECNWISLNMIKDLQPGNEIEISGKLTAKKFIRAFEILRRFGIYSDRPVRSVRAFVNQEPLYHYCFGYGRQLTIHANGAVSPCDFARYDPRHFWGHIGDQDLSNKILYGDLTAQRCARTPIKTNECFDCVALGLCGGGCANEAYIKYGDVFALDRRFCEFSKTFLEWMIDDLVKKLIHSRMLPRR